MRSLPPSLCMGFMYFYSLQLLNESYYLESPSFRNAGDLEIVQFNYLIVIDEETGVQIVQVTYLLFKAQSNLWRLCPRQDWNLDFLSEVRFPHLLWGVKGISKALLSDLMSLLCARHWRNEWCLPICRTCDAPCDHRQCRNFVAPLREELVYVFSSVPTMPEK